MVYTYENNDQPFKGDDSPLIGLLAWPDTNNAQNYLTPAGTRARLTSAVGGIGDRQSVLQRQQEQDQRQDEPHHHNAGFTFTPFSWGYLKTNLGTDAYTNQNLMLRHPESALGVNVQRHSRLNDDITRNINSQTLLQLQRHAARQEPVDQRLRRQRDPRPEVDGRRRRGHQLPRSELRLDQQHAERSSDRTIITQRRLVSAFGQATLDFKRLPVSQRARDATTGRRRSRVGQQLVLLPVGLVELHLHRRVSVAAAVS